MPEISDEVDVLICGGGPVGLLVAYCLARYGGVSSYVIEQHDRAKQTAYGRAAMIAPCTLEMLDQLDLADALGQIGFVARGQVSYKNGELIENLTPVSANISDTFFDYLLFCRQRYTEDVIRENYGKYSGKGIHYGARLLDFAIDDGSGQFAVKSVIETKDKGMISVRSKYIIGADGGRSTVRELAGIAFEGERSNRHWIRIDGVVETNMPEARKGLCGIASPSHRYVFSACLDHGATRIGFALPEKLWEEMGANISLEDVVRETQKAMQPFTLEFKTVDWWTVYSVGQRLASDYRKNDRIFLAGDAAHTHSSGAAQGMNTGMHDAVNLSWKLAGHLKGWLSEDVLDTYAAERRPIAQRIIEQDKIITVLTGGEIPEQLKDDPEADANELLKKNLAKNASLNLGLGVTYPTDDLTIVASTTTSDLKIKPGERTPDVLVQRPGIHVPLRLLSVMKNRGRFTIMLFCGDPSHTQASTRHFREYLDGSNCFLRYQADIFQGVTIIFGSNDAGSAGERLGTQCFGEAFFDVDGMAHERYGIPVDQGAVVVARPDGMIGTVCALEDGASVSKYFKRFVAVDKKVGGDYQGTSECEPEPGAAGELALETEDGAQ